MDRQRIDKWLWHARVVRTRSAAAGLVSSGQVRVNRERVVAPSQLVRPDDVVVVALDRQVRILRVVSFAERRGASEQARALYADLTPLPERRQEPPPAGSREPGSGRPTKRERRAIDRLHGDND